MQPAPFFNRPCCVIRRGVLLAPRPGAPFTIKNGRPQRRRSALPDSKITLATHLLHHRGYYTSPQKSSEIAKFAGKRLRSAGKVLYGEPFGLPEFLSRIRREGLALYQAGWKVGMDVREAGGLGTLLAGAALLLAGGEVARLIADDHTLPLGNNANFAVGSVECAINWRIADQVLVGQLPPDGLE